MSIVVNINEQDLFPVITLHDQENNTKAEIYSFGALLNAFTLYTKTGRRNIIDGFASPADAKENITNGFKSAKLNPFVCRMNKGEYTFNGETYKIKKFYLGEEAIHGLLFNIPFTVKNFFENDDSASVQLIFEYDNKTEGYPFPYITEITYTLSKNKILSLQTTVTNTGYTDMPLSDGWHPYFQLGDTVNDLELKFNSNTMIEFDGNLLPTGNFITYEKFETLKPFGDTALDNCFLLKDTRSPACVLKDAKAGLQLQIHTDDTYRYLQVYTPPHRKSIAIENLSSAPDAFNNGIGLVMVKPGEQHSFVTSYRITVF